MFYRAINDREGIHFCILLFFLTEVEIVAFLLQSSLDTLQMEWEVSNLHLMSCVGKEDKTPSEGTPGNESRCPS